MGEEQNSKSLLEGLLNGPKNREGYFLGSAVTCMTSKIDAEAELNAWILSVPSKVKSQHNILLSLTASHSIIAGHKHLR